MLAEKDPPDSLSAGNRTRGKSECFMYKALMLNTLLVME
jgi:hypothetical protein